MTMPTMPDELRDVIAQANQDDRVGVPPAVDAAVQARLRRSMMVPSSSWSSSSKALGAGVVVAAVALGWLATREPMVVAAEEPATVVMAPTVIAVPEQGAAPIIEGPTVEEPKAKPIAKPVPTEASLVDAARAAVRSKDTSGARVVLDRIDSLYPRGTLREERDALRAVLALRKGDNPDEVLRTFDRAHPNSMHRALLERVVAQQR